MCCKNIGWLLAVFVIIVVLLAGWRLISGEEATSATMDKKLSKIDQDPTHYVVADQPTLTISPAEQAQLTQTFLALYFSPWDDESHSAAATAQVLQKIQQDQRNFSQQLGWQFTRQAFSAEQRSQLLANADLIGYPNINLPAIVVNVTEARIFPTWLPQYGNPQQAGEGYPFDNWINSYLFPGIPVRVLQQSQDHLWYLLKTASYYGWTPARDVGFVSADFIAEWKKHAFVVAVRDGVPLYNTKNLPAAAMRKAILYPVAGEQGQQLQILTPFLDANGNAQIQILLANKSETQAFPMPATAQTIAEVGRSFIGGQYGWGNLYELRDCSSTTEDILAGFGFWLPRNSAQQALMGQVISMTGLSRQAKLKIFAEQAVPFYTLVHFPGHVALYLGMHNGQAYILQDAWGLHTHDLMGKEGRAIIGRTVITPLDFSKGFRNIKSDQLDGVDSISILKPETYSNPQLIQENVWK